MNISKRDYPCGCYVAQNGYTLEHYIGYCSMHEAAPEMWKRMEEERDEARKWAIRMRKERDYLAKRPPAIVT